MRKSKKRAQSVVEYLLVFGALVIAVLLSLNMMSGKYKRQYETSGTAMDSAIDKLDTALEF